MRYICTDWKFKDYFQYQHRKEISWNIYIYIYIRQLKLFQWVFDINVNSVYTICIKDCVQIDICINCIAYYSCDLEKHEYVRTGTKLIKLIPVLTGWFI